MLVLTWHSEPGLPAELHVSNIGGNAVKNPTVFCSQSCNLEDTLGKQRVPATGRKTESEPSKAGHDMQGRKVGSLFSSSDASLGKDGFKVAVSYLPCGKLWKCVLMWAQLMCVTSHQLKHSDCEQTTGEVRALHSQLHAQHRTQTHATLKPQMHGKESLKQILCEHIYNCKYFVYIKQVHL